VLELNGNGAVINRFTRGIGGHLIRSDHHGWYVFNVRGDVVQRLDSQNTIGTPTNTPTQIILHTYLYDAFGNQLNQDHQNTNPFRFAAEYYDWETSTIYLRARNFNPRTGRFTQPDPLFHALHGNLQSCILQAGNLFMYVTHNPVMWTDPTGLFRWNEDCDDWIVVSRWNTTRHGGTFSGGSGFATIDIWGVNVTFNAGADGVRDQNGTIMVRADTFYNTIVGAAGGEMVFLGGHGAFGGTFSAYHMHIAMFVSPSNEHYYNMFHDEDADFTRWGLRFAYISGTMGFPLRTVGSINEANYMERADRQFWHHLSSGVGTATALLAGYEHFRDNHNLTFPYNGRWTNSTSYTIGLVNAVGLNHGLSAEQRARAWGFNNAFSARHFGR